MAGASLGQFIMLPLASLMIDSLQWSRSLIYISIIDGTMLVFSFALNFSGKSELSLTGTNQSIKEALFEAFQSRSYILLH